jgi:HrpA-like RNA helicase
MAEQQTPEMLRLSLQDLAIRVKMCKLGGIEENLSQAMDPPSAKNIRRAIDALIDVRALTGAEELTPLGQQLARLPLDVFLGKLILLGSIFKCLDATITIAAILSSKSPFSAPFGARSQADSVRHGFRRGKAYQSHYLTGSLSQYQVILIFSRFIMHIFLGSVSATLLVLTISSVERTSSVLRPFPI